MLGRSLRAVVAAFALVACASSSEEPSGPSDDALSSTLPGGAPLLRMPFEAGTVVLCQQGNQTGATQSHSSAFPNTRFAIDLSVPGADDVPILAMADGKVIRTVLGASPASSSPGAGFGNQVAIEHAGGLITNYSHLERVDVAVGAEVRAGSVLGRMGNTGQAGNDHLHLSLHRALPPGEGLLESFAMEGILAADVTAGEGFAVHASTALLCARSKVSMEGHLYASENAVGVAPAAGPIPAAIAATVEARRLAVVGAIESAPVSTGIHPVIQGASARPAAETLALLVSWMADHPADHLGRYWLTYYSLIVPPVDRERVRANLAILEAERPATPAWLGPWTVLRSAQFDVLEGRLAEARAKLDAAAAVHATTPQGAQFEAVLASLRASAGA